MHERRFHRDIDYLRDPQRLARLEVERVVDLVLAGLSKPQSLLDIGTGSGVFAEAFAAKGLKVSGVDANPLMLPAASKFVPSGEFKEAIAEKLPYQDAQFDLAFMGLVLHETDDPLAALQEAYRVATRRTAILEWPDEDQQIGPPRAERLPANRITAQAKQAGFKKVENVRLETLILYLLDC
jgi:ubiquinone/menaquinone biosynthesis C-methylase UbiE